MINPNAYRRGNVVIVPDYVYVDKSFGSSNEIDVVIRDYADNPLHWHDNTFLFIAKMLDPEKEGKQIHLTFNPQQGPTDKLTPMMDLVLPVETEEIQKSLSPMPRWRTYIGDSPKFNLSADTDRPYGFCSVGKSLETHQVQVDFDKTPWDFEDNVAGTVRVNGILETLENPVGAMLEIYRMLKPGGRAIITVPSTRGTGTFSNPAYKSFWNESSFEFWTTEGLAKAIEGQSDIPSVFDLVFMEERTEGDSVYIDVVLEKPRMWKARHSIRSCMNCKSTPTVEILWAEGRAHAWFCKSHLSTFKSNNPGEVSVERELRYKVASSKWSEGPPTREQAEEILGTKIVKFSVEPITRFVPPSPTEGDDGKGWIQDKFTKGVSVVSGPLMNGLPAIVQSDGKRVSIRFDDGNERYVSLSKADEGLESLGNLPSFIVDADIGVIQDSVRWSTERLEVLKSDGIQLPDNARIVITVNDLLYWDDRSLVDETFTKRKNLLSNRRDMLNSGGLSVTKFLTIKSEGDLKRALTLETFGKNEGVTLRSGDWLYEPASSLIPTLPSSGMYKVLSTGGFGGSGQAPLTVDQGRTRRKDLPPFLKTETEGLRAQADSPKNALGLTAAETLERLRDMGRPFTSEEIDFREDEKAFESGDVCGACRFYLRDAESENGRCQVLSPDVEVPWWFSSKAFIDARQEGLASLEEDSDDPKNDGAMLAFYVATDVAQRLAVVDGEKPEGMHITLAYFGKAADLDEDQVNSIRRIAKRMADEYVPMKARISGIGRFSSEDDLEPVYASIDSEELQAFRMLLAALLESEGLPINTEHGFTPHITIKYVAKGEDLSSIVIPDDDLTLDNLSLTLAGNRETFLMQNTLKQVVVPVEAIFDALRVDTAKAREGEIQTLILDKSNFEEKQDARGWVKDHDFKFSKIDETDNTWRFRQFDPDECDSGFRTFEVTTGVQAVVCRGQKDKSRDSVDDDDVTMYRAEIIKTADKEEKRFTFSVVYKPDEVDAHGEFADADELQEALWGYVKTGDRRIFLQHGFLPGIKFKQAGEWVEIVAWPEAVKATLRLPTGESFKRSIPANTIWMGVIWEPWAWRFVKEGKIRGFSFGGTAQRITRKFEAYGD